MQLATLEGYDNLGFSVKKAFKKVKKAAKKSVTAPVALIKNPSLKSLTNLPGTKMALKLTASASKNPLIAAAVANTIPGGSAMLATSKAVSQAMTQLDMPMSEIVKQGKTPKEQAFLATAKQKYDKSIAKVAVEKNKEINSSAMKYQRQGVLY